MNQFIIDNPNTRITSLFQKSIKNFRTQSNLMLIYSIFKVITSIALSIMSSSESCEWSSIDLWVALICFQSAVSIWCYVKLVFNIKQPIKSHIVKIAEDLHQVVYIPLDENTIIPLNEDDLLCPQDYDPYLMINPQEESKKIQILTTQIKYEAGKKNVYLKWIGQLMFLLNQALIIFGFILEFSISDTDIRSQYDQPCKSASLIFMFIFLILSVYQYIDLYVIMIMLVICLPFIILFLMYQGIKSCQQKRKSQSFITKLLRSELDYNPQVVEGDGECRICLQAYNLHEKVIVLPCNSLHHFHSNCISAWLKVTSNCPLCRQNFGEVEDINSQLNQQLINQNNINQEL